VTRLRDNIPAELRKLPHWVEPALLVASARVVRASELLTAARRRPASTPHIMPSSTATSIASSMAGDAHCRTPASPTRRASCNSCSRGEEQVVVRLHEAVRHRLDAIRGPAQGQVALTDEATNSDLDARHWLAEPRPMRAIITTFVPTEDDQAVTSPWPQPAHCPRRRGTASTTYSGRLPWSSWSCRACRPRRAVSRSRRGSRPRAAEGLRRVRSRRPG
jgi:hypothetical protein